MRLLLPEQAPPLGLYVLPVYSAYALYTNGELAAHAGVVGAQSESSTPYLTSRTVTFDTDSDVVDLVFHVSNFANARAGLLNPIYFGEAGAIERFVYTGHLVKLGIFCAVFLMCLYHLSIYLLYRTELATLYFSVFCFLICLRLLFSYDYLISGLVTLPWSVSIRVEYLTVYLGTLAFFAFVDATFPDQLHRYFKKVLYTLCVLFSIGVLVLHSLVITEIIALFHIVLMVSMVYLLIQMIRAATRGEADARVFMAGVSVLLLATMNDVISFNGLIKLPYLTPAGVFIFVIFQAFILARRFTNAMSSLEQLTQALSKSNQIKENFLATIGHEMRSPMNGIVGGVDLLKARQPDSPELAIIESSANEMVTLIDRMLDITQLNQDSLRITPHRVELQAFVQSLSEKYAAMCQKKGLTWQVECQQNIPEALIFDSVKVRIVLEHLLDNAVKFTERGGVRLVVKATPVSAKDAQAMAIVFHVIDTGVGIGPQHRERIFEAFSQMETGYNRRFGGLGLGLALSNRYARLLGGQIVFQPDSQGTRFSFLFNGSRAGGAASNAAGEAATQQQPIAIHATQIETEAALDSVDALSTLLQSQDNARVLIVEDIPANQLILRKMAEKLGFVTDMASNGIEALEQLEANRYVLVLMDCQMPLMDGYEATRRIRQSKAPYRDIGIIAVTANVLESEQHACFEAGMDDFIAKPVRKAVLAAHMVRVLKRRNGAATAAAPGPESGKL